MGKGGAVRVPRLVVAAPWSGSGKTTIAALLMRYFREQGLIVQGFKVGPDYIDGSYHEAVTGRAARTLDLWMGGEEDVRREFVRGVTGADVAVVEGVMGLFDSGTPDGVDASTARVARELSAPVVLVVDVSRMAESAAALVAGFQSVSDHAIQAVVLNRVGSVRHADMVADAILKRSRLPVLAALPDRPELALPERHLGLVPSVEDATLARRLDGLFVSFREAVNPKVLADLLQTARQPVAAVGAPREAGPPVVVAVAYDAAFNFYYRANLDLLEDLGAALRYFSPLDGEPIPDDARLLYVGGGFPEQFLPRFRRLQTEHARYRKRIEAGLITVAECGGYLWLARSLRGQEGEPVPMLGVVPCDMALTPALQGFGYRTLEAKPGGPFPPGTGFRGHAFHHAAVISGVPPGPAWTEGDGKGRSGRDGVLGPRLAAGFLHAYWPSNPAAIQGLLARARLTP